MSKSFTSLTALRAQHLAEAALLESFTTEQHQRSLDDKGRRELFAHHYFNHEAREQAHVHRSAFRKFLNDLAVGNTDGLGAEEKEAAFSEALAQQKEAIQGIVSAWGTTLPDQLIAISGQLSQITNQKWYGRDHEAGLLSVVNEIAYCMHLHREKEETKTAMNIFHSAINPRQRIGFGTDLLDFVAHKGHEEAASDQRKGEVRKLKYLPQLDLKLAA